MNKSPNGGIYFGDSLNGMNKECLVKHLLHAIIRALPRTLRYRIIMLMLRPEMDALPPADSLRWLLEVDNSVHWVINHQCHRWGNGVHIKHQLMDGIHAFFYERIPQGAHVLDVGCGYGAVAYDIAQHANAHVIGVDLNERDIAFARQRFQHPNLRFEVCDVTQQDIAIDQVDVVVLSSVIEHLPNRIELLSTLRERFQPHLFLIRVPTHERDFFVALKRELGMYSYIDRTHLLEYSPELFTTEMSQAGLVVQSMHIRWGDIWAECVPHVQQNTATNAPVYTTA